MMQYVVTKTKPINDWKGEVVKNAKGNNQREADLEILQHIERKDLRTVISSRRDGRKNVSGTWNRPLYFQGNCKTARRRYLGRKRAGKRVKILFHVASEINGSMINPLCTPRSYAGVCCSQ